MKIFVEKIIFVNRAPFDKLELDFEENEIAVLTAINGSGKTTVLSHIVDAWHEMARPHFSQEFKEKENDFYRISSTIYNLNRDQPSFVYIRFKTLEGNIDYIDIINKCTEDQYNEVIIIDDKIPFSELKPIFDQANNVKKTSSTFDKKFAEKIFSKNLVTYFPSYRYETPGYLNAPYEINLDFKKSFAYLGYLNNPIEVTTGLPRLANWIMDVILDMHVNANSPDSIIFNNLNGIVSQILLSKQSGQIRLGVGRRGNSSTRIQIVNKLDKSLVYPTIFNLSSGESSMLCIFGELLRQADNNQNNILLDEITGIVLIDEVDKHLHIKLQKEILPKLFKLFPNVQFILSSHSPFLSMGLAEEAKERTKIIDLDNFGITKDPSTNELYNEVYNMMIDENDRFKEMYNSLNRAVQENNIPLIITEGKTDIQHIRISKEKLNIKDCEVEFCIIPEKWGDGDLKQFLENSSKIKQNRKIIGIFDRDTDKMLKEIEKNGQMFKNYGNNIYAICLPLVNEKTYGHSISIEHYYPESLLKKPDADGRRLFLGSEFYTSGISHDGAFHTKFSNIQHKVKVNGVVDEKVYESKDFEQKDSIALAKAKFANLIENNEEFVGDFKFDSFNLIFERIKLIMTHTS